MAKTVTEKIIESHLVEGRMEPNSEIAIRIDHTLTQDATGTMVYLEFMAMGIPRVQTELSVSYVDHNLLQTDFKNADDHRFLQSVAAKYGVIFSRPGNGISHQVHLERFCVPGKTLLGSDSHTPTNGGGLDACNWGWWVRRSYGNGWSSLLSAHAQNCGHSSYRRSATLGLSKRLNS